MWIDGIFNDEVPKNMSRAAELGFLAAIEALPGDTVKEKHQAYLELARRINSSRIIRTNAMLK